VNFEDIYKLDEKLFDPTIDLGIMKRGAANIGNAIDKINFSKEPKAEKTFSCKACGTDFTDKVKWSKNCPACRRYLNENINKKEETMSKLFEEVYNKSLKEAKGGRTVTIKVYDGNMLLDFMGPNDPDTHEGEAYTWEIIEEGFEYLYTGSAKDFSFLMDYDGEYEDSDDKEEWMEGFQESRQEIYKMAATTASGGTFNLYGNQMDAVRCQVM